MQPCGGAGPEARPWWQHAANSAGDALNGVQQGVQRFVTGIQQQQQQQQQLRRRQQQFAAMSLSARDAHTQERQQELTSSSATSISGSMPSVQRATPKLTTKEELGRSTWLLLHTLAAQFPEQPTRQQQKDARQLVDCLTRIYPCADCAKHFQEVVRANPPVVSSGAAFQQWLCAVHNTVNRSIGKPVFNCALVAARWTALDCGEETACDMAVGKGLKPR